MGPHFCSDKGVLSGFNLVYKILPIVCKELKIVKTRFTLKGQKKVTLKLGVYYTKTPRRDRTSENVSSSHSLKFGSV